MKKFAITTVFLGAIFLAGASVMGCSDDNSSSNDTPATSNPNHENDGNNSGTESGNNSGNNSGTETGDNSGTESGDNSGTETGNYKDGDACDETFINTCDGDTAVACLEDENGNATIATYNCANENLKCRVFSDDFSTDAMCISESAACTKEGEEGAPFCEEYYEGLEFYVDGHELCTRATDGSLYWVATVQGECEDQCGSNNQCEAYYYGE